MANDVGLVPRFNENGVYVEVEERGCKLCVLELRRELGDDLRSFSIISKSVANELKSCNESK